MIIKFNFYFAINIANVFFLSYRFFFIAIIIAFLISNIIIAKRLNLNLFVTYENNNFLNYIKL